MSFAEKDCFQRFIADEVGTQKKEVGILLPGNILDELTCWTPRALGRNSKTFLGLRRLNGRPLFVWIAQSFFKSSTAKIAKL